MGYSLDMRGRLCCDACGRSGGVRKRTCPHKVVRDQIEAHETEEGTIYTLVSWPLPYCYPSALCPTCYAKHKATLHVGCKEGAARSTSKYSLAFGLMLGTRGYPEGDMWRELGHAACIMRLETIEYLVTIIGDTEALFSWCRETVSHAVRDADSGLAQVLGHHDPTDALGYRAYEKAYLRAWELTRLLSIARGYDLAA